MRSVLAFILVGWMLGHSPAAVAEDADQPPTVLHLTQTVERSVTRDLLRAELRVEETGADPKAVQSAINRRMGAALDRARHIAGVRVETGFYNVSQERPPNALPRWRGSQSLMLSGKDVDALLNLAGTLQSDGLSMSSLRYEASPEAVRGAEDELTAGALAAVDRRAASIAGHMHLSVLRYRDLRVGNAEAEGRPMPRFPEAAPAGAALPPAAEPGDAVVRVTVQAELLLGGPRP